MLAGESVEDYFVRVQDQAQRRKERAAPAGEDGLDGLLLMEAMGTHFHEHHDAIMRWSWKFFCAKWCRLIKWSYEEAERRAAQDQERDFDRVKAHHAANVRG